MKKIILTEAMLKTILREMRKDKFIISEISSSDAYNKFYKDFATPEQWNLLMAGAPTMTPLHKTALEAMKNDGQWDDDLSRIVNKAWRTLDEDGKKYLLDIINMSRARGKKWLVPSLIRFIKDTMKMPYHTEVKFADNGLLKLYEDNDVLVTCTLTYAAEKKYYGDSHWCTASDIAGRFDGREMFLNYTEDGGCLVQFVCKKDRTKSIQAQFYADGNYEEIRDFFDHEASMQNIYELFNGNWEKGHQVVNNLPFNELCEKTQDSSGNEFDYWAERQASYSHKMEKAFLKSINNGAYDNSFLEIVAKNPEALRRPRMQRFVFNEFGSAVCCFLCLNDVALFNLKLMGSNENEKNFIHRLLFNSDEYAWAQTHYAFVVSIENGKITENSHVLYRFNGQFCDDGDGHEGCIKVIENYDYSNDYWSKELVNIDKGTIVAKNIGNIDYYKGRYYFSTTHEEYENNIWSVVDANSGQYLGKIQGIINGDHITLNENRVGKNEFMESVKESVNDAIRAANEYLFHLNLSLSVNFDYDFDDFDTDAIGVYEDGSVFEGEISVSYNINALFDAFNEQVDAFPQSSEYTILDEIAKTTIYHEMGHGICDLMNDYLQNSDDLDELYDSHKDLFDRVLDDEEDAVEKFAWDFYDGNLNGNDLAEMVNLYLGALDSQSKVQMSESDIKRMVNECISLLMERNMPILYHFVCLESLLHVLKTNRFDLGNCGDGTYYMSTTRNRNSVQGYPYMQSDYSLGGGTYHNPGDEGIICRLELDGELLRRYGKINPFDYIYDEGDAPDGNGGYLNGKQEAMTYFGDDEEMYHQPFSQGEDRLVSKKKSIPNADRIIRRIDVYIDPYKAGEEHWQKSHGKELTALIKNYKDKINFYDDRGKFDRQV